MKTIAHYTSLDTFITARMLAQKITVQDFGKLMLMHSNAQVMATLGGLRSEEQTREYLEWNLKHWEENGFGLWLFYDKKTREFIGRACLRRATVENQEEIELAYALMPKFWRQGFATEMAQACMEIAFEILQLESVVCFTLTTNLASQRVMQKAGFQYERQITHVNLPHVLYRLHSLPDKNL